MALISKKQPRQAAEEILVKRTSVKKKGITIPPNYIPHINNSKIVISRIRSNIKSEYEREHPSKLSAIGIIYKEKDTVSREHHIPEPFVVNSLAPPPLEYTLDVIAKSKFHLSMEHKSYLVHVAELYRLSIDLQRQIMAIKITQKKSIVLPNYKEAIKEFIDFAWVKYSKLVGKIHENVGAHVKAPLYEIDTFEIELGIGVSTRFKSDKAGPHIPKEQRKSALRSLIKISKAYITDNIELLKKIPNEEHPMRSMINAPFTESMIRKEICTMFDVNSVTQHIAAVKKQYQLFTAKAEDDVLYFKKLTLSKKWFWDFVPRFVNRMKLFSLPCMDSSDKPVHDTNSIPDILRTPYVYLLIISFLVEIIEFNKHNEELIDSTNIDHIMMFTSTIAHHSQKLRRTDENILDIWNSFINAIAHDFSRYSTTQDCCINRMQHYFGSFEHNVRRRNGNHLTELYYLLG